MLGLKNDGRIYEPKKGALFFLDLCTCGKIEIVEENWNENPADVLTLIDGKLIYRSCAKGWDPKTETIKDVPFHHLAMVIASFQLGGWRAAEEMRTYLAQHCPIY